MREKHSMAWSLIFRYIISTLVMLDLQSNLIDDNQAIQQLTDDIKKRIQNERCGDAIQ